MIPQIARRTVPTAVPIIHIVPDSPTGTIHSTQSDSGWQSVAEISQKSPPTLLLDATSPIIRQCKPAELAHLFESLKSLAIPVQGLDATSSHIGPSQCSQDSESALQYTTRQSSLAIGTKVCTRGSQLGTGNGELHAHQVRESLQSSLRKTKSRKISWLIAQRPDSSVALGELTAGFEALLQEDLCDAWGVRDFPTRQLRDLLMTCRRRELVGPRIYQARYNLLSRDELEHHVSLLRDHGMQIHAYDPLAAGLLSDQIQSSTAWQSHRYDSRQREEAKSYVTNAATCSLTAQEVALRWLSYHSCLHMDDAIILTASSMDDLAAKVSLIAKGPLSSPYLLDKLKRII